MRKIAILLISAVFLAACSTPKYTYYFDHYDYNSGKKAKAPSESQSTEGLAQEQSLKLDEKTLVASDVEGNVSVTETKTAIAKEEAIAKLNALSKEEKKELKKEVKKYVKENKSVLEANAKAAVSGDLKLALIFGVVGIVLMLVLGDLFWIGTIAILIALFFLVRYLINN